MIYFNLQGKTEKGVLSISKLLEFEGERERGTGDVRY
jgi:hypothetical protein